MLTTTCIIAAWLLVHEMRERRAYRRRLEQGRRRARLAVWESQYPEHRGPRWADI
jgi:hypothetical protein